MSSFNSIISEFREKRLWPVALVLLGALIAIPALLTKSASSQPVPPAPVAQATLSGAAAAIPAVSVSAVIAHNSLHNPGHNPFIQPKLPVASSPSGTSAAAGKATGAAGSTPSGTGGTSSTGAATTAGGSASTSGTGSTAGSGNAAGTDSGTGTDTTTTPSAPTTSAPTGLTATQSYSVTLAVTNSKGGFDTTDSLQRLSLLPSQRRPLLIELGVLKGAHRVLFLVQPGAVVSGPGICTPGRVDCEILALAPNQIEHLSVRRSAGADAVADFAVTAITTQNHPSAAAARDARQGESATGRRLLNRSTLSAVSLFRYDPDAGVLIDQRNLTVGGS